MNKYLYALFIFSLLLIVSCSNSKTQQENIACVNSSQISVEDFQKEVSTLSRRDPTFKVTQQALEEQLSTIIDKKLLLQEAMKKGITESPQFVETIKTFWEQTLIKELIESKTREWSDKLYVTDEEINNVYQRMQYLPTIKMARIRDRKQAEEFKEKMIKGIAIAGEETIGPISREEVRSETLIRAFDMNVGDTEVYENEGVYEVIRLIKKEKTLVPPLNEIYTRLKNDLLEQKKQSAIESWLNEVKNGAKIQVNSQILKRISNGQ